VTRSTWKEVAEALGVLAIVASLIAVAVQLHQTQQALLASTYQARAFDAIHEVLEVADSDHLAGVLSKTNNGADAEAVANLGPEDHLRLFNFLRGRMIDWDNEHYQYQHGFLDEGFFELTTTASIRKWAPRWRAIGLTEGRPEFRAYVDQVLEQGPVREE